MCALTIFPCSNCQTSQVTCTQQKLRNTKKQERLTNRHNKSTFKHKERQADTHTSRLSNKQKKRQTDRKKDRQTDGKTDTKFNFTAFKQARKIDRQLTQTGVGKTNRDEHRKECSNQLMPRHLIIGHIHHM